MLNNIKKTKQDGFTIIEVMIVLAIAGLIMLVVFLAVPALQRNSRNTAIKNDVANVTGGISTFVANNNGTSPSYVAGTGTINVDTSTSATANRETAKVQGSTAVTTVTTAPTAAITAGTIQVKFGNNCSVATGGNGTASPRAAAVYYSVETSAGSKLACSGV